MCKGRILLIDDDPAFTELMQDITELEGYTFCAVQEVDCLATLLREHQPDILLLDFCLKGRNGGELCYYLRQELQLELPVVLISAYTESQLPLERIPCNVFIPKPFDIWSFLACIAELLQNQKHE